MYPTLVVSISILVAILHAMSAKSANWGEGRDVVANAIALTGLAGLTLTLTPNGSGGLLFQANRDAVILGCVVFLPVLFSVVISVVVSVMAIFVSPVYYWRHRIFFVLSLISIVNIPWGLLVASALEGK